MAEHIIEVKRDTDGTPVPYNPVAKCQWFTVDGTRDVPLFAETEEGIDAAVARFRQQLAEEDAQREAEQAARSKRYSKLRLYAALAQAGLWDALEAWLKTQTVDGVNAWIAFTLARDLTSDHPLFASWLAEAQTALGVTDEQVAAILAAAELAEGE